MKQIVLLLVLLIGILLSKAAYAESDFYLYFEKCKLTIGYLVHSNDSLKITDGDGSLVQCSRISQAINCEFINLETKRPYAFGTYLVRIETSPILIFSDESGADYFVVDQVTHAATIITRVVDPQFAGAKVCQGTYMTESERKSLKQSK